VNDAAWPLRRICWWALWWAVLLSAAEFAVFVPLRDAAPTAVLVWWLTGWVMPLWLLAGMGYLLLARDGERRGSARALWLHPLLLALAFSLVQPAFAQVSMALLMTPSPSGMSAVPLGSWAWFTVAEGYGTLMLYILWVNLFYGGLLVGAYVLVVRAERMRSVWREAAIARGSAERALDEARLHMLRSQVDPRLLLDALRRCERLYRSEPSRADDLLDRLVDFLRLALPGLKSPDSTLAVELELALAWVALHQALSGRAGWHIERPASLAELPFPSLVMLPLLAWGEGSAAPRLEVEMAATGARLRVQGIDRPLPEELAQRTRASLYVVFGTGFAFHTAPSAHHPLEIELFAPA
jgi:hypothetical protein